MRARPFLFGALAMTLGAAVAWLLGRERRPSRVFVGTQGSGPGAGIHAASLDETTGDLTPLGLAAEMERPTWVLADAARRLLFAVSEVGNAGDREGAVASFAVGASGERLREVALVSSSGGGATHLALADDGATLFVANFGGGQVATVPVADDGGLSPARPAPVHRGSGPHRRQQGPHPHGVTLDPAGRFLLAPDMGTDEIYIYRIGEGGALAPADPPAVRTPAGSGPRLALFGRDGRFVYVLSELSAEIFVFRWDPDAGRLADVARVAMDEAGVEEGRSAAGFALTGDGRRLYASNRRTDAIHVFAVDPRSGLLDEVQRIAAGGSKPWTLALSPSGRWLLAAAQGSGRVVPFAVDRRSGRLTPSGRPLEVGAPTGLAFA